MVSSILESSTEYSIIGKALDGRIVLWNEGARRLYGYEYEEVVGKANAAILHSPEDCASGKPQEIMQAALAYGKWEGVITRLRKNGDRFQARLVLTVRKDPLGAPSGFLLISKDISQEIDLTVSRRSEDQLRGFLESAPDAMVIVDESGKIKLINAQTEKLFGYQREELLGEYIEILLPPRFRRAHPSHRASFFAQPRVRPMGAGLELFGLQKDGREIPVEISLSPLSSSEGALVISTIRDITDRKRVEEGIRALNRALQEQTAELEATNKELEAFTYSVSHDLRAPLRHIDGFSKLLAEVDGGNLSEEGKEYLKLICDGTREMGDLVDDLLNLARIGRSGLSTQVTGINVLVDEVVRDLKRANPDRAIDWKIDTLPFVDCDPGLMKQVLINLLSNAVKFTRPRNPAVIEIGSAGTTGGPVVFIRDNGVGFGMKNASKLFGVFQRLHRPEEFEGTGIGLAIVERIMRKHEGRVWAEAEVDHGATFYIAFPPLVDQAPQPELHLVNNYEI